MPDQGDLVGGEPAREGLMLRRIWTVGVDGEGLRQLTDNAAYRDERPQWSADGTGLLFVRMDAGGSASLWWLEIDGAETQPTMLVDAIGPIPFPGDPQEAWFGYYGHIDWDRLFDWWQGPPGGARSSTD